MNNGLKNKLKKLKLVAFDFDGVFTDGKVILNQDGIESVTCSRKDSMGIHLLKQAGLKVIVISSEQNPVMAKRCQKMGIKCHQTTAEKLLLLKRVLAGASITFSETAFVGDDVNDLGCLRAVGIAVTVADGHPECKKTADHITTKNGGDHAVREICDLVLKFRKPA